MIVSTACDRKTIRLRNFDLLGAFSVCSRTISKRVGSLPATRVIISVLTGISFDALVLGARSQTGIGGYSDGLVPQGAA